jgi:hypothetical protein
MPSGGVLVVCAVLAMGYYVAKPVAHGINKAAHKTAHGIVHVVTFGKK